VPLRGKAETFLEATTLSEAPLTPLAGENSSQAWSDEADQTGWSVVTVTLFMSESAPTDHCEADNDTLAATTEPAWVTVKVAEAASALTVMVPVRGDVEVLAKTETPSVAPLAPDEGDATNHG